MDKKTRLKLVLTILKGFEKGGLPPEGHLDRNSFSTGEVHRLTTLGNGLVAPLLIQGGILKGGLMLSTVGSKLRQVANYLVPLETLNNIRQYQLRIGRLPPESYLD